MYCYYKKLRFRARIKCTLHIFQTLNPNQLNSKHLNPKQLTGMIELAGNLLSLRIHRIYSQLFLNTEKLIVFRHAICT